MRIALLVALLPALACGQTGTVFLSGTVTAGAAVNSSPKPAKVVPLSGTATSHGGGGTQRK